MNVKGGNVVGTGFRADMERYAVSHAPQSKPVVHEPWPVELGVERRIDRHEDAATWRGFMAGLNSRVGHLGHVVSVRKLAVSLVEPPEITDALNIKHRDISRDPRATRARRQTVEKLGGQLSDALGQFQDAELEVEFHVAEVHGAAGVGEFRSLWGSTSYQIAAMPKVIGDRTLALAFSDPEEASSLTETRNTVLKVLADDYKLPTSAHISTEYVPVVPILEADRSLQGVRLSLPAIPALFPATSPRVVSYRS